jgi:hypothetical protein
MKTLGYRMVMVGLMVLGLVVHTACSKSGSPSSPTTQNNPTATSSFTQTPTLTPGLTFSATPTMSRTATPANTSTNTATLTVTNTITDTATQTLTNTPTVTSTLTITPTPTATCTITNTPFQGVGGSVTYTGAKAFQNGFSYFGVALFDNPNLDAGTNGVDLIAQQSVSLNGGNYVLNVPNGVYYLVTNYAADASTYFYGAEDGNGPLPGEKYAYYQNSNCALPASAVTVNGQTFLLPITITDSCPATGLFNGVTYTGSSTVNATNQVHVLAFQTGGTFTTMVAHCNQTTANGKYKLTTLDYAGYNVDLLAYVDKAGTGDTIAPGDPVTAILNVPVTFVVTRTVPPITFNDTFIWPNNNLTPQNTATTTNTATPTPTFSATPSMTDTPTDTATITDTPTLTATPTPYRHTITIDGTNDFIPAQEQFATTSNGYNAYVSWDANNLYCGYSGPDIAAGDSNKWFLIYVDVDPGANTGASTGYAFNTQAPTFPAGFSPKYLLRWITDNSYSNILSWNGSSWQNPGFTFNFSQNGTYIETSLSLSNIGSPSKMSLTAFMIDEQSGSEWTYGGLYADNFTDGYNVSPLHWLSIDLSSPLAPNTSGNEKP